MVEKSATELGHELAALIRTKRDGAAGNINLAPRCLALMEAGADLNVRDDAGMTPLMHAAANYRSKIFNALVQRQPDVFAQDDAARNALDHAKLKKQRLAMAALVPVMAAQAKNGFKDTALKNSLRAAKTVRFKPKA